MSKLDKNQRIRTSKPRQTFDLSHDYIFTATTGQLRPVSHDLLQPGDTVVDVKFNFFARSMPFSTAAMVDVDFMVDYFFVPLELLWLRFGAWWSRTKSFPFKIDSEGTLPALNAIPTVDLMDLQEHCLYDVDNHLLWSDRFQRLRLMDDLGLSGLMFGDYAAFMRHGQDTSNTQDIFPWQLAAYQCIYQHWYRDEERESFDPGKYSLDGDMDSLLPYLTKMRYVGRMDDYFTATKLSPLVANVNNDPQFLHDFDVNLGDNSFDLEDYNTGYDSSRGSSPINVINNGDSELAGGDIHTRAVSQLRALFAQEKLLHVMNMTHKDYDSQTLARLGYNIPTDVKHGVQHLGHDTCQLHIQEIVSGSNTFTGETGSALGDLAGQGKAITDKFEGVKKFTAPCHGVLMSIFTCRPRPKYTVSALRKDMMLEITDFFTPELDDLGMQPQYLYETKLTNNDPWIDATQSGFIYSEPYTIVGWNYRYEYLKRNINRSSLAFMRGTDGRSVETDERQFDFGFNSFTQWTYARIGLDKAYRVSSAAGQHYEFENDYYSRPHFSLYKVLPNELDNIMLVNWIEIPDYDSSTGLLTERWDLYPWLIYQRDPFVIDGRFSCKKVSAMSLYSMPKLI